MIRRAVSTRPAQLAVVVLLSAIALSPAFAWQMFVNFGHTNRYGGEADIGSINGQVEYPNAATRWVRAYSSNVKWTQAQINWMKSASGIPAMVYHITPKNQNGDVCGKLRTLNNWNWSNLPGVSPSTKGCGVESDNEVRFYFDENTTVAGQAYWFESVFTDTGFSGAGTPKEPGQVGIDTYWTNLGVRQNNDFHGKICVNADQALSAVAGVCQ